MKKVLFIILLFLAYDSSAKNCKKGIPCGNSCISTSKTCHVGSSYSSSQYTSKPQQKSQGLKSSVYYSVNGNGVSVYTNKDTHSKVKFVLNKKDRVQIISTFDKWYKISAKKGDGYILKKNKNGSVVIKK